MTAIINRQTLFNLLIWMHVLVAVNGSQNIIGEVIERVGRSFCMPLLRLFNVELRRPIQPGEYVGVTGDHARLGGWQLSKSLQMYKRDESGLKWYLRIGLCARDRISYRYFIYKLDRNKKKRVLYWEAQMHPRYLQYYEMYAKTGEDVFGEVHEQAVDSFSDLDTGWLRNEYVVELQFIWQDQLQLTALLRLESFLLKLYALNDEEEMERDIDILVSHYSYKDSDFKAQTEKGVRYTRGDIVIFRIVLPLDVGRNHKLRIYTQSGHPLAGTDIRQNDLKTNGGVLQLPLYDYETSTIIGTLKLPYLIIEPHKDLAKSINFMTSFHHYWPANWPTVEIAQRGLGASFYKRTAKYVENTLASFQAANQFHADMVQMNVILTKDYVPVLWHDFGFYTAPKNSKKIIENFNLEFLHINELTYDELKAKRVFVRKQNLLKEYTQLNTRVESQAERLFITLDEVFAALPNTLGLMIEVKWPQQMQNGYNESWQTLDKNRYVDILLQLAQSSACGRAIIFASFDADICTMIKLKQHTFPVVFLTYGRQAAVETYHDLRAQTFISAINFAASANILGSAPHAYEFIKHPDHLNFILNLNQAVFLWGDVLKEADILFDFRSLEVSGLVYSGIDRFLPNTKRSSFFEASELQHIFAMQCFITLNSTTAVPGTAAANAAAIMNKTRQSTRFSLWPKV